MLILVIPVNTTIIINNIKENCMLPLLCTAKFVGSSRLRSTGKGAAFGFLGMLCRLMYTIMPFNPCISKRDDSWFVLKNSVSYIA